MMSWIHTNILQVRVSIISTSPEKDTSCRQITFQPLFKNRLMQWFHPWIIMVSSYFHLPSSITTERLFVERIRWFHHWYHCLNYTRYKWEGLATGYDYARITRLPIIGTSLNLITFLKNNLAQWFDILDRYYPRNINHWHLSPFDCVITRTSF